MKGEGKMKKNNLYGGLIYLLIGLACLVIALNFESKLESLLSGFAGAGICSGTVILWKYYYWTRPGNKGRYKEKLENENIELHDERKIILRDKSGRYSYIVGLIVTSLSIVVFSVIDSFDIVQNTKLIIIYLAGFLVFQYIIGILIFSRLNKKY